MMWAVMNIGQAGDTARTVAVFGSEYYARRLAKTLEYRAALFEGKLDRYRAVQLPGAGPIVL